jgi:hypothetical protein
MNTTSATAVSALLENLFNLGRRMTVHTEAGEIDTQPSSPVHTPAAMCTDRKRNSADIGIPAIDSSKNGYP